MEKISIIVPVYNVQAYLSQCLDSILQQSYSLWEAILVDDGSIDHSGEICDSYAKSDPRFVVIHKQNGGAASAKNAGLDHISGGYVAFIDSDDYVEPNWLNAIVSAVRKYDADVIEFDFDEVYRNESKRVNSFTECTTFSAENYLAQYVKTWTSSLFCNKLFRAELVKNVRFKSERRCIDDEFFTYKAVTDARLIVRIPDVLYHYRQRASSAVYNPKNQYQIANDSLDVLIERYLWINAHFPKLRRTYLEHDIQILFYFSTFNHTEKTALKFRRISKFYLQEVIRHPAGISLLKSAVKLQFFSTEYLRREHPPMSENKDIGAYFQ